MTERQEDRVDLKDDRVEDLEVREDEAREVGGGKKSPQGLKHNSFGNRVKHLFRGGNKES